MVRAMGSVPQSQTTMSAMLTMLATSAVFLFDGGCAVAVLFILVCGVALLQSRLIKAAGHWTQHGASAIQLNNSRNMSRTCTSAAELFYLRHTRSCAATACGNKGGGTSHSTPLQMSGADFIARLLQSVCQQVCLTIIMHWGRALLALFRPSARLLQSIAQMVLYYAKIAMKLIIMSSALQRDMLILCTPLELAACFHLVEAYMHRDLYTYHCESDHCRVSAVSAPSAQEIATIALALLRLSLSIIDWHVPRGVRSQQLLCRILTAMSMQALRMDLACAAMAFLLPTFGKRPQEEGSTARKRTATMSPATEQTPGTPTDTKVTVPNSQSSPSMQPSSSAVESGAATEHTAAGAEITTCMKAIVTEWNTLSTDDARDLVNAAQVLLKGIQNDVRNLCNPWGVQLKEKKRYRPMNTLKQELKIALTKRAKKLKSENEGSDRGAATEHTEVDARADDALAETPRSSTQVAKESTATEHASAEFCIETAMDETLRRIKALHGDSEILVRVVDHACSSEQCVSHRIAAMCREASWKISKDLCNDQPLDACGYIAADAVCRLREAALAEANAWHRMKLPDYARLECIDRGNQVLRKRDLDRILDSDHVNRLVRHYSYLDQRRQAEEEWWAGAVALDHFLIGLPDLVSELAAATSTKQHQWKAWIVNTQSSAQLGSHWFTVVVGAAVQNSAQLQQSTATSSTAGGMLELSQPLQSSGSRADPSTNNYPNLFESLDPVLSNALGWAHANAMHPRVAAWLRACSQWDSAVATKKHQHRKQRRQLCKEHDIPCTRAVDTNEELDTAMVYIRRQLTNRIKDIRAAMMSLQPLLQSKATGPPSAHSTQQRPVSADTTLHPPRKKTAQPCDNKLDNYFTLRAAGDALPEIEELHTPHVATDVSSTYLRLHAKRHIYAEDQDFHIVKDALYELGGYVSQAHLTKLTRHPRNTPKTIRRYFKERNFNAVRFNHSTSAIEATGAQQTKKGGHIVTHSHMWRTYYVKLLVLAQARQWLSATERLDPIADAPSTPKTNFQLADAIKQPKNAEYAPFGGDFEDTHSYSPVISRLLFYAEIHNCSDHGYGTFSAPKQVPPYTYRQLQEWIIERRRLHQRSNAIESATRELVQTAADLAAKLCAFASDGVVVKHLIDFALPEKKRADAAEVTALDEMLLQSTGRGAATEHIAASGTATEHTKDTDGDDKQADNQREAISAATEHASKPKKQLRKRDAGHRVTLSQQTAKAMADGFFKFVEREHLQQHFSRMSAGQILVLCIFHSRLSWQKGKPLELHDRDHYWIPKPLYTPASQVKAPSPPHFAQRIKHSATEHVPPEMQPPRSCCLCGKGFIDWAALWEHCELDHHSWAEAAKRTLWEAEQLEAVPLLPPDKRRIIQNFTNALIYSKPAEGHFGRDKVCMRQRIGCATCAKVAWIDSCFPCYLFQECPEELRPRVQNDADDSECEEEAAEEATDEEEPATEQRRGRLLKHEIGYYVLDAHAINELLDVKNTSKPGRRSLQRSYTLLRYNTPATQSIDGC